MFALEKRDVTLDFELESLCNAQETEASELVSKRECTTQPSKTSRGLGVSSSTWSLKT